MNKFACFVVTSWWWKGPNLRLQTRLRKLEQGFDQAKGKMQKFLRGRWVWTVMLRTLPTLAMLLLPQGSTLSIDYKQERMQWWLPKPVPQYTCIIHLWAKKTFFSAIVLELKPYLAPFNTGNPLKIQKHTVTAGLKCPPEVVKQTPRAKRMPHP